MRVDWGIEGPRIPAAGEGAAPAAGAAAKAKATASFAKDLEQAIETTRTAEVKAEQATERFAAGEPGRLHETVLSMEKAELSLRLLVGARNRIVDAYREVMHLNG